MINSKLLQVWAKLYWNSIVNIFIFILETWTLNSIKLNIKVIYYNLNIIEFYFISSLIRPMGTGERLGLLQISSYIWHEWTSPHEDVTEGLCGLLLSLVVWRLMSWTYFKYFFLNYCAKFYEINVDFSCFICKRRAPSFESLKTWKL